MHVLGYDRPMKVFMCVPFCVGDDPQQNKLAGVYEAGSYSCRLCDCPTIKTITYNKNQHPYRNLGVIEGIVATYCDFSKQNCDEYFGTGRTLKRKGINQQFYKDVMGLSKKSIHFHPYNPFYKLPMGAGTCTNILYGGSPADDFHTFCAGLLSSIVSWVLKIVMMLSASFDPVYHNVAKGRLEERIVRLPSGYESTIPHVPFTKFKSGLTYLVTGKL
jgi:hypothetical protein